MFFGDLLSTPLVHIRGPVGLSETCDLLTLYLKNEAGGAGGAGGAQTPLTRPGSATADAFDVLNQHISAYPFGGLDAGDTQEKAVQPRYALHMEQHSAAVAACRLVVGCRSSPG